MEFFCNKRNIGASIRIGREIRCLPYAGCLNNQFRLQAVIFYPFDWEDSSLDLLIAFSSLASQFRSATTILP